MSLRSFLRSLFWPSSRDTERKKRSEKMEEENEHELAVRTLMSVGINFLAVDFDQTLVDYHTRGAFKGDARTLETRVRPVFRDLLPLAHSNGIHIAIVTFSGQVDLIRGVLELAFPEFGSQIPIRGRDGSWYPIHLLDLKIVDGKQKFMASAAQELVERHGTKITRASTLLIDDDANNVNVALHEQVQGLIFNTREPTRLLSDIRQLIR